jgi:tetratricopeptide (TPR) repeat protein
MLERLTHRLDALGAGPRDAPTRQQTLRGAIGWSDDLLEPVQRELFAQFGVFAGGCTLEAAEAVCGAAALDGIAALVDQSLVRARAGRFEMLETIREYALERLAAADAVRRRHARFYAALAENSDEGIRSGDSVGSLERLGADHENLRAAIEFALADGDATTALRLGSGLWRYWAQRGGLTEGRALLTAALAGGGPPSVRFGALNAAGVLAGEQGDFAAAREYLEESLELARATGDRSQVGRAAANLGTLAMFQGAYAEAIRHYEASLPHWRELGDDRSLSRAIENLGNAYYALGERDRAIELLEESLRLARLAADPPLVASALQMLGRILAEDDPARTLELTRESLTLARDLGDGPGIQACLESLAAIAGCLGDPGSGALLLGAAEAAFAARGALRQPEDAEFISELAASLRGQLGEDAYAAIVREGGSLDPDEVIARALSITRA